MATTIHDIAKEANVSIAAVSKALNNRDGVSEELRNRIKAIAERLGYEPSVKSRDRAAGEGFQQIAVVYDRYGMHLFEDLQRGIESILPAAGFREVRFTMSMREMSQESIKKMFFEKILGDPKFKGLMTVFFPLTDSDMAHCQRNGIPVVQLNINSDVGRCVTIDDFGSAYEATKKFIQLGHTIIGHVGHILSDDWVCSVWSDRLAGYKKALADHGIEYNGAWTANEPTFIPRKAGLATRELIKTNPGMTAILYTSDVQAMGGLRMLREMNLRVPEDVAVIGFDDISLCEVVDPPLASVHLPMLEMGKVGAEMMLEAIKSKSFANDRRILKSRLVIRRSCDPSVSTAPWTATAGEKTS